MAAILNQKIQACLDKGNSQAQCSQAFQTAANTKDTCVAFYLLDNPNASLQATKDRCASERANAAMTAAMLIPGAAPFLQAAGSAYYSGQAIDSCTAYNQAKNNSAASQETKTALQRACYINSTAAVTGAAGVAGQAMAPGLISSALLAADAAGNLAASSLNTYDICKQYPNSPECLTAGVYNLIALQGFGQSAVSAYQTGSGWVNSQLSGLDASAQGWGGGWGTYGVQTPLSNLTPEQLATLRSAPGGLTNQIFDADSSLNPLVTAVTGGKYSDINDPEFILAGINDNQIIRQKYGLPSQLLQNNSPEEYIYALTRQSEESGIPVMDIRNFEAYRRDNPNAGAFFSPGGTSNLGSDAFIAINPSKEEIYLQAGELSHEYIHSQQNIRYPGMPIEVMEYEAYVGQMRYPANLLEGKNRDFLMGWRISGSATSFYKEVGAIAPWMTSIH
jgi:hypothetical protein